MRCYATSLHSQDSKMTFSKSPRAATCIMRRNVIRFFEGSVIEVECLTMSRGWDKLLHRDSDF